MIPSPINHCKIIEEQARCYPYWIKNHFCLSSLRQRLGRDSETHCCPLHHKRSGSREDPLHGWWPRVPAKKRGQIMFVPLHQPSNGPWDLSRAAGLSFYLGEEASATFCSLSELSCAANRSSSNCLRGLLETDLRVIRTSSCLCKEEAAPVWSKPWTTGWEVSPDLWVTKG